MWTYNSANGNLSRNGELVGQGYSGHGEGVNNPMMQSIRMVGPIPQGCYTIGDFFDNPGGKGPCVTHLTPNDGTDTFGRSGFMIHGDNTEHNETASEGCIIMGPTVRQAIRSSGDTLLEVV